MFKLISRIVPWIKNTYNYMYIFINRHYCCRSGFIALCNTFLSLDKNNSLFLVVERMLHPADDVAICNRQDIWNE